MRTQEEGNKVRADVEIHQEMKSALLKEGPESPQIPLPDKFCSSGL